MLELGLSKVDQAGVETGRIEGDFELKVGTVILELAEMVDKRTEQGITNSFRADLTVHLPGGESFDAVADYDSESQTRGKYAFTITGADQNDQVVKYDIAITDGKIPRYGAKGTVVECSRNYY